MGDSREMFRSLRWPFEDGTFPADLGAVVQRTILDGTLPALVVGHSPDGSWYVGDGVSDPNAPGAVVATHIWHAIERNGSIAALAWLAPGHEARREGPGDPWRVERVDLEL